MHQTDNISLAIVGLGYVGLPLAVEFSNIRNVVGYDNNKLRINELNSGFDKTNEIHEEKIKQNKNLTFTSELHKIKDANCYIICVPTPINNSNQPDLSILESVTNEIGSILKKGDIVIYESTVYPGCTEEVCVPILENVSSLIFNEDFFCGYSPERLSPGGSGPKLKDIIKVTSGSTKEISILVDNLYSSIISAGTFNVDSIKIAEAAKVTENTQRDLNIALVNELAVICSKLNIDTLSVLEAAATKWNFNHFKPGLVGGHCIGVDPYYLTYKAAQIGYHPEVILAGRRVNNNIVSHITNHTIQLILNNKLELNNASILILGITFKENCPDTRNSKVIDLVQSFKKYKFNVDVYDPVVDIDEKKKIKNINFIESIKKKYYTAIVIAVEHDEFISMGINKIKSYGMKNSIIYDVKGVFDIHETHGRL